MIHTINNKLIIKATTLEHVDVMNYVEHLKEFKEIIADYIDVEPHSCHVGGLLNLKNLGRKIKVLLKKDCFTHIKDLFSSFDCEFI